MVPCQLKIKIIGLISIACLLFMGCSPSTIYQWGDYEDFLYKRYNKPGSITTQEEINTIENQLAQTYSNEQMPPPGLHAHLGYLYISDGQRDRAIEHFNVEKKLFPESTHFIDGLIERMTK
jgi:hypothetical protein